ncbi:hypothetical protein BLUE7_57 [Mycobacterium phage Blue7]|uniref:Uncharacterized protein n=1 Tax=Mycobacterium phage Blue7 TaxID=1089117 RepID=G8I698_9CAUD|nr:hypothetical protein CL99_gp058 [Mycobacterium phage Blue7]AER48242.1 hypothetical protein BLUE7_57 [Mycobacterium phage Blue7]
MPGWDEGSKGTSPKAGPVKITKKAVATEAAA